MALALNLLSLSFAICKMGIMIEPPSWACWGGRCDGETSGHLHGCCSWGGCPRQLTMAALPVLPLWLHSPAPEWASAMTHGVFCFCYDPEGLLGPSFHPWMEDSLSLVNSYISPCGFMELLLPARCCVWRSGYAVVNKTLRTSGSWVTGQRYLLLLEWTSSDIEASPRSDGSHRSSRKMGHAWTLVLGGPCSIVFTLLETAE